MSDLLAVCCWEDNRDEDGNGYTCLLADGHDGSHEWTPDAEIIVRFGDDDD